MACKARTRGRFLGTRLTCGNTEWKSYSQRSQGPLRGHVRRGVGGPVHDGPMGKRYGTSTSAVETSARYRAKQAKRRRSEEARWAALAGPVEVRSATPTVDDHEAASRQTRGA